MKTILIALVAFICCATPCTGATYSHSCMFRSPVSDKSADLSQLKSQLNKYRAERAAGIGLMAGGGAALIAGEVIMILSGVRAENANLQNYSSFYDPLWRVGFSTAMVGVGALAPGIPLYVIGTRRAKMIKRRIAKIGADMPRTDKP